MLRFTLLYALLPAALVSIAGPVFAQNDADETGYSYEFKVDFLDGDQLQGDGPRLVVMGTHARVLLIRPRTSFVAELIRTTEAL